MIQRYNSKSFQFFIPGMILQFIGVVMTQDLGNILGWLVLLSGTALAFIGFGYYAKAKGRLMAWGMFAFLGLPGLIVLTMLRDDSGDPWNNTPRMLRP